VARAIGPTPLHAPGVAQQLVLQRGDAREPLELRAPVDPSPERSRCVLPAVEPVAPVDRLEQAVELDLLEVERLPARDQAVTMLLSYSHTRRSDTSLSV